MSKNIKNIVYTVKNGRVYANKIYEDGSINYDNIFKISLRRFKCFCIKIYENIKKGLIKFKKRNTIKSYLEFKEIKPKELKKFELIKSLNLDLSRHDKNNCLNCDYEYLTKLCAGSWSDSYYCHGCKSLVYINYTDKMSGNHNDLIEIYQDKKG